MNQYNNNNGQYINVNSTTMKVSELITENKKSYSLNKISNNNNNLNIKNNIDKQFGVSSTSSVFNPNFNINNNNPNPSLTLHNNPTYLTSNITTISNPIISSNISTILPINNNTIKTIPQPSLSQYTPYQ